MSNETYWALKKREWAAREQRATRRPRRGNVPLRLPAPRVTEAPIPAETLEATVADIVEEPSYRDLQAAAKELDIPANQSADDLKAAIEEAG